MRVGRAVTITLSIALVGAIIGGVVGAGLFAAGEGLIWIRAVDFDRGVAIVQGAAGGATLGAVLAPLTAWGFLRRVALGKALLHTTVGTTIGAAVGLIADRAGLTPKSFVPAILLSAVAGFLAAAIRLRLVTRTRARVQGMQSSRPGSQP
jgi:hypothetical protein